MSDFYYVLNGREPMACDLETWGRWCKAGRDNRRVAKTETSNGMVSTVFLGLDHSFDNGPPLLFETMVFGGTFNDDMDRYSTYDEAEAGHKAMVEKVEMSLQTDIL